LTESYPDLKASEQFLSLQADLKGLEDEISQARKYYNGAVKQFNVKVQSVPSNLIAGIFHFVVYPFFEVTDEAERSAVKVDFNK
ncbi:MAG: LemA family protein, partial [Oscillospiraceae bacterium]